MHVVPFDPNLRDWIQAVSWIAAIAAGVFGIVRIAIELKSSREQREQELRWRMAQAAKALNDEMLSDRETQHASTMLDWDGRELEIKEGVRAAITAEVMLTALRTVETNFTPTEAFVRDAFDHLFYYLGIFEHYISRGLVAFSDLEYPIEYYVKLMASHRPVIDNYLANYGFRRAAQFLERFEAWRSVKRDVRTGPGK